MMYILYNTFSYLQAGNIENVVVQDIKFTFRAIVLEKYEKMALLEEKDGRIFLTRAGIHVSNTVMADFLLE